MPRNKLTAVEVRKKVGKLFDGAGLYLSKRTPNSGRWTYRYTFRGKTREMGLGAYPAVSLADARTARDEWAGILATDRDPISVREERRTTPDSFDPTFAEAAQLTLEAKQAMLKRGGESGRWLSPIRLYMLPAIGAKRMSQIRQADIRAALSPIWKTKHPTAEKALQRTKIIFDHMRLSGADCDPFTVERAKHMLGAHQHQPQPTRASDWRDMPAIFERLSGPHPSHMALRWKILTLVRSSGVRGARFDEIDGDVWTVPPERMKGREGRTDAFRVPLSSAALDVLQEAKAWQRGPFMFPGPRGTPVSEVAINKVFAKADPSGTPHGLRTAFRTWVQDQDAAPYDVAETVLAHIVGSKVERAYARSDLLDRRRVLMEAWGRFVTSRAARVARIG